MRYGARRVTEPRLAELRALGIRPRPLLAHEGREAVLELLAEVDRCRDRINFLLEANNREVDRRRRAEQNLNLVEAGMLLMYKKGE